LIAGCGGSNSEPPHGVPWHLVSADGRTLHLSVQAGGPPCDAVLGTSVRETSRVVTVTVRAGSRPGAKCPHGVAAILGTFPISVRLHAPLGSRTLRDGAR
jgi:hypothetical protein